jgi:Lar family restriction alleviation protein
MAMTIELKPCPFCGGEVQLDHPTDPRAKNITFILCDGCGAVTSFLPNLTGSKAIQAYNRRAYITPCGGCGNSDPEKRCLNCRHDFNAAHADLSGDPRSESGSAEEVAQWLYANGFREAAATIRNQLDVRNQRIADLSAEVRELVEGYRSLYRAYVNTLEVARDRIRELGGECDPVDVMERGDPALSLARERLAKFTHQEKP